MTLEQIFNKQISNLAVLYFKLHNFHWFVSGKEFFTYHKLFEELYNEATELVDQFAERLLSIKGTPVSTMKEFLQLSNISEGGKETCPVEISKVLISDYSTIVSALKEGIKVADDVNDTSTSDLFTVTITSLEKHIWMLGQVIK